MNDNETQRIAAAINALRPDWPTQSLATLITSKLGTRTRRDVAVALTWVACDSATKTPARVLEAGPWWNATNIEDGGAPRIHWLDRCVVCNYGEAACRKVNEGDHEFRSNGDAETLRTRPQGLAPIPAELREAMREQLDENKAEYARRLAAKRPQPSPPTDHDPRRQKPDAGAETEAATTEESADA